jgi:hypothetical protein
MTFINQSEAFTLIKKALSESLETAARFCSKGGASKRRSRASGPRVEIEILHFRPFCTI